MRSTSPDHSQENAAAVAITRMEESGSKKFSRLALLTLSLLFLGTTTAKAVEYGDVIHKKDGTWTFKNTEDPGFEHMRNAGWITEEQYQKVSSQTGKNWIEPADAVLNLRRELEWNRYLKTGLHLPDLIDLGLEQRTRFESMSHPWRTVQVPGNGSTDVQIPLRSRVRFGLGGNGPFRFLFEGQDARSFFDGDPGQFRNNNTVNEFDVLQLLGSVKLENVFGTGLRTDFHFGRMTMDMGRRRFVARNDFRNTVNAFDGVHWQIAQGTLWRFRAFFTEPVAQTLETPDEQSTKLTFWGTYFEGHHFPLFQMDAYYFGLNDQAPANQNNRRAFSTFGGRLYKESKAGDWDYEFETTWQFGKRGNLVDHFVFFNHFDLGYTFDILWKPRFVIHYDYASGDSDPNDNKSGTFDTLFGARRFEFNPTGIYGPFFRSNLETPGWRVTFSPMDNWILSLKHRVWFLAQAKDAFAGSGLRDVTGQSGTSLGQDVELRAQWVISRNLDLDAGYVHWFKGSFFDSPTILAQMPQGGNKDTDYFYISMRVRI